jgi:hypothetical protein
VTESGRDEIDGTRDLGQGAGYGKGDGGVFGIDQVGNVQGRFAVEVVSRLVRLFGAETAESGWPAFQVGPFGLGRAFLF